jgi:hypothetical protein
LGCAQMHCRQSLAYRQFAFANKRQATGDKNALGTILKRSRRNRSVRQVDGHSTTYVFYFPEEDSLSVLS